MTCGIAGCTESHEPQDHNEVAALRAELQEAVAHMRRSTEFVDRAQAEVERMRPVVEAADRHRDFCPDDCGHHLCAAVDAFRAAQQETNDEA